MKFKSKEKVDEYFGKLVNEYKDLTFYMPRKVLKSPNAAGMAFGYAFKNKRTGKNSIMLLPEYFFKDGKLEANYDKCKFVDPLGWTDSVSNPLPFKEEYTEKEFLKSLNLIRNK